MFRRPVAEACCSNTYRSLFANAAPPNMVEELASPFLAIAQASRKENAGFTGNTSIRAVTPEGSEDGVHLLKRIGKGGYAIVWLATYYGDFVAVKIYEDSESETSVNGKHQKRRPEEEYRIMCEKSGKYILGVKFYDATENRLISEYCPNGSLHYLMSKPESKQIVNDWSNRLKWAIQIAQGMTRFHDEPPQAVHRDLKTENILITEHFDVRIGDFGLAKKLVGNKEELSVCSLNGVCMLWQPPEVTESMKYSKKSDVYSFGVIMYEMLTLQPSFRITGCWPKHKHAVQNIRNDIEEWNIPSNRLELPGKWHPCLEKYIKLMKKCCETDRSKRPTFATISDCLQSINAEYDKSMKHSLSLDSLDLDDRRLTVSSFQSL